MLDSRLVVALSVAVWAAVPVAAQRSPVIRVDTGTAGGIGFLRPRIVAVGDTVHARWIVYNLLNPGSVRYNRSTDHGRSWQLADVVLHPVSGPVGDAFAASGNNLCSIADAVGVIQCRSSVDGGATWRPLSNVGTRILLRGLEAAVVGSTVHAVWIDSSVQDLVHYQRSTDGGLTWLPQSVVLSPNPGSAAQLHPRLRVAGTVLHAAWLDTGPGSIVHTRSLDGGLTWQQPGVAAVAAGPDPFALAADGPNVFVAYGDAGNTAVRVVRSIDGGATWSGSVGLGPGILFQPNIGNREGVHTAAEGNLVAVAWSTPNNVLANVSRNFGASWQSAPTVLDSAVITKRVSDLAVRGNMVIACWEAVQNFGLHLRFDRGGCRLSNDAGLGWHDAAVLEPSAVLGTGPIEPRLGLLPDACVAIWGTQLAGSTTRPVADEIHATLLYGYQPYGTGIPGTGGATPAIAGATEPLLGNTITLTLANARGGAPALIATTFAGPAMLPVPGGAILVQPPLIPFLGTTTGAGSFALPIAIPGATAFQAVRLNAQGFVLDSAGPGGFAATAGLELWTM